MPACKACGEWFAKTNPHEELCFKCVCALCRLSSYVNRVVRCKNCTNGIVSDDNKYIICCRLGGGMEFDDFCSYGERKDKANES